MLVFLSICLSFKVTKEIWEKLSSDPNSPPWLVFAWAPWCPHCQRVFDTWDKISEKFKDDADINVVSVNCTLLPDVCQKIGVRGYPSFFERVSNSFKYTNVDRSINGLINAVEKLKLKHSSAKRLMERIETAEYPLFVFRIRDTDDAQRDIVERVFEQFGLVQDKDLIFNIDNDLEGPCQGMVYNSKNKYIMFEGRFTFSNITKFVEDNIGDKINVRNKKVQEKKEDTDPGNRIREEIDDDPRDGLSDEIVHLQTKTTILMVSCLVLVGVIIILFVSFYNIKVSKED